MIAVTVHAPHLREYASWLEERVSTPICARVSPTFREDDVLPLLPDAEIVVTSHWSARLGEAARSLRFLQMPGAGWD